MALPSMPVAVALVAALLLCLPAADAQVVARSDPRPAGGGASPAATATPAPAPGLNAGRRTSRTALFPGAWNVSRASAPGQAAALVERNKRRLAVQRATAELLSQCAAQRGRHDCETRTRLGVALHETLRQAGDAVVAAISERNPELWPASLTRAEAAVQRNEDVLGCADQDAVALQPSRIGGVALVCSAVARLHALRWAMTVATLSAAGQLSAAADGAAKPTETPSAPVPQRAAATPGRARSVIEMSAAERRERFLQRLAASKPKATPTPTPVAATASARAGEEGLLAAVGVGSRAATALGVACWCSRTGAAAGRRALHRAALAAARARPAPTLPPALAHAASRAVSARGDVAAAAASAARPAAGPDLDAARLRRSHAVVLGPAFGAAKGACASLQRACGTGMGSLVGLANATALLGGAKGAAAVDAIVTRRACAALSRASGMGGHWGGDAAMLSALHRGPSRASV